MMGMLSGQCDGIADPHPRFCHECLLEAYAVLACCCCGDQRETSRGLYLR